MDDSRKLTNTSYRKHLAARLNEGSVPKEVGRHVTGHKQASSLDNYAPLSNRQQRILSDIVGGANINYNIPQTTSASGIMSVISATQMSTSVLSANKSMIPAVPVTQPIPSNMLATQQMSVSATRPTISIPETVIPEAVISVPAPMIPEAVISVPAPMIPEPVISVPAHVIPEAAISVPAPVIPEAVVSVPAPVNPEAVISVPAPVIPEAVVSVPAPVSASTDVFHSAAGVGLPAGFFHGASIHGPVNLSIHIHHPPANRKRPNVIDSDSN